MSWSKQLPAYGSPDPCLLEADAAAHIDALETADLAEGAASQLAGAKEAAKALIAGPLAGLGGYRVSLSGHSPSPGDGTVASLNVSIGQVAVPAPAEPSGDGEQTAESGEPTGSEPSGDPPPADQVA